MLLTEKEGARLQTSKLAAEAAGRGEVAVIQDLHEKGRALPPSRGEPSPSPAHPVEEGDFGETRRKNDTNLGEEGRRSTPR
jgi:hypothetical protein